jgi:hypothetical protein
VTENIFKNISGSFQGDMVLGVEIYGMRFDVLTVLGFLRYAIRKFCLAAMAAVRTGFDFPAMFGYFKTDGGNFKRRACDSAAAS